jgi:hypothetical protein
MVGSLDSGHGRRAKGWFLVTLERLFATATSVESLENMVAFALAPQQARIAELTAMVASEQTRIAELKAARAQRDAEASPPVRLWRGPSRGTR